MQDAEIILTKNRVLQGVKGAMEGLGEAQQALVRKAGSGNPIFGVPPKVSRGENYLGLPWLVLDFPRVSGPDGIFFVRSFFWWGRFFSSTLHLSGRYAALCAPALSAAWPEMDEVLVGVGENAWVHDLGPGAYRPAREWNEESFARYLEGRETIKLARQWPVRSWQEADAFWMENWKFWLMISDQLPRR